MKKIITGGAVLGGLFLGAHIALASFDKQNWEFFKEIKFSQVVTESILTEIDLDGAVLNSTTMNDLRILSSGDVEVPFVVREAREEKGLETYAPRMQNLSRVPGSHTSFILDFGATTIHNEITIDTSSKNFRKNVRVEGSNDASSWQVLVNKAIIYDYTLEFVARNTRVIYPESTFRYLRVTVSDPDEPITITGTQSHRLVTQKGKGSSYTITPVSHEVGKNTEVVVDLGGRGIVTERAVLGLRGADFERSVTIYGSNDNLSWVPLGGDVVYAYKTSRLEGRKTDISWQSTRMQYLKFVIANNDNQPLGIAGVTVFGPVQTTLFLADKGETYRLFYGNPRAEIPSYDFSSISRYFAGEPTVTATLGDENKNPAYVAPKPPVPPLSERIPYLIPAVLGLLVLVLGLLIVNLFKRTGTLSK